MAPLPGWGLLAERAERLTLVGSGAPLLARLTRTVRGAPGAKSH
jgi:hypothetical protein